MKNENESTIAQRTYFGGFFFATDTEYLASGLLYLGAAIRFKKKSIWK